MKHISIIIPTFNSLKYLSETLNSVLAQNYPHFECILVDDGSSDGTESLIVGFLKSDNRLQFYNRPETLPKGPSSCRNYGVEKAKGAYVIFLDADDLLSVDCLKNRVSEFEKHSYCDFLVFQMERFFVKPDFSKKTNPTEQNKNLLLNSFIQLHSQWPITSPIYKTEFFSKIGFNQELVVFEDLELAIRAIVLSGNFKVFETIDCYYRNDESYKAKYNSQEVKTRMIKGFPPFILSIVELMDLNSEKHFKNAVMRSNVVQSYKKILTSIIVDNSKLFYSDNKKIVRILAKNGFLSIKQRVIGQFSSQILVPFASLKGSGISRLIRFLYR